MNKEMFLGLAGALGSGLSYALGGFDTALETLMIFMAADYITGIIVAGVFHKSGKTETGCLESRAGFKGICRKGLMLLIVIISHRLDLLMGTEFLRDGTIVAFICNEALSIVENGGLMGIPVPEKIKSAIEVLSKKGDKNDSD